MKNKPTFLAAIILLFFAASSLFGQDHFNSKTFSGLNFRSIGPAFMSGRIADIAIHPENQNVWYVAVGSGGVWKTVNSGITWSPIFDKQASYSIGCVTIDKNNPHHVWVGTGENVGGRHVGYGDGIYLSKDGGASWKNMGLKQSEHISKIIIHPENSDIIWAAAQGPLWSKGGERGLYKTIDGGKTWNKTLGDDEWTGVTDIVIDPRNPDILYAASWERHRNVAAYVGGGPGTAIYKSTNGGEKWKKLSMGLPKSDMGKIGLAISPQNPDVVYAAIELDRRSGGVYRTETKGESWKKMSNAVSGATGPHYYQELVSCPHKFDRIYLIDVRMQISEDGGKTFTRMSEKHKHSDNHALAFRNNDPNYLLVGTDGGIYESFDLAQNWRYVANLPVTQYYKVAVDDKEPFYTIYGGTQDNNTQGGPSRTDNKHGIRNSDWFVTLFGDGHQPATEPGNPDIMYSELQEGFLFRVDRKTGELIFIQPQPERGEKFERYNWDAPILVSPHSPTRLYFGSYRVWKSDDRGDSWTAISGDLTRDEERLSLPIDGKTRSWDAAWDLFAMSTYNTITSIAESPVQEGLIYAGTDDGLIQVTEDGGSTWRKITVDMLPGVPATAFVNDIKADLYDANTVYIALDNHKFGDLKPYLFKSTNKGKSWTSISGNIPDRTLIWRMVQDHVKPDLLFTATEFGIYFTIDGGKQWTQLTGGIPTISFRDLVIQKRENDLVCASFGRGFYVLDDYSALRNVTPEMFRQEATLFPPRKAWWYIERSVLGGSQKAAQGAGYYSAPNPPFGAVFTFYLSEDYESLKQSRQKTEKQLKNEGANIPFPGWEQVEKERREEKASIILTIQDEEGKVIRKIEGPTKKGFHRVAWDLRTSLKNAIDSDKSKNMENLWWKPQGYLVEPGTYAVTLAKRRDGVVTTLSEPQKFTVEKLYEGSLTGSTPEETVAFWNEISELNKELSAFSISIRKAHKKVDALEVANKRSDAAPGSIDKKLFDLKQELYALEEMAYGNKSKDEVGEKNSPTINSRILAASIGTGNSTYGPTPNLVRTLEIAKAEFKIVKADLETIITNQIPAIENELKVAGAPLIR